MKTNISLNNTKSLKSNWLKCLSEFGLNPFQWLPTELSNQTDSFIIFENIDDPEIKLKANYNSHLMNSSKLKITELSVYTSL